MAIVTKSKRLLLLGGTREARELADCLKDDWRWSVISSLAGRTREPETPAGMVRVGGFGGVAGLSDYLRKQSIDLVVDATHPFAAGISQNACDASHRLGLPYVRLSRPPWYPKAGDRWQLARDIEHAVTLIAPGCNVFLTIGRQELSTFSERTDIRIVARMIEMPAEAVPTHVDLILARPPFSIAEETALIRDRQIEVLVTKNAGGESVEAKLIAARDLGIPVIMIERPSGTSAADAQSIEELMCLLDRHYAT